MDSELRLMGRWAPFSIEIGCEMAFQECCVASLVKQTQGEQADLPVGVVGFVL